MHRKAPWRSREIVASLTMRWCPTYKTLHQNPHWLSDAHAHMGEPWDKPNTNWQPGKARWLDKGNLEEMLCNSDSNYPQGTALSLSPPTCLTTHTVLFSLLMNTLLVLLLSLSVGILLCKAEGTGWALSLTNGLVSMIWCSHCQDLTPISGWEPKPCFKLLQAKPTQDHYNHALRDEVSLACSPNTDNNILSKDREGGDGLQQINIAIAKNRCQSPWWNLESCIW